METPNKKQIFRDALNESLQKVMGEAKVPYSMLLSVVKELESYIKLHKSEIENHGKTMQDYSQHFQKYQTELERIAAMKQGEKGDPGETPKKGVHYFDGKNAEPVDEKAIINKIFSQIKVPPPIKGDKGDNAVVNEEELAKAIIALIKKKKLLSSNDINGMQGFSKDGINYRFEELMHGGGGTGGGTITYSVDLSSQCNGSNKVFTVPANTNFVLLTGTDAPIIYKMTTDYTGSGTTTLTMTAQVNAPSSGATLILTYIV